MARLLLPMTVRTPAGPFDLMVSAPGPLPWREVRPAVLNATRLPAGTVLHLGIGPVEPDWLLGSPPLLAGMVLDTTPSDDLPESPPLVLAVASGPDAGRCIPLVGEPLLIGRDGAADLTLRDPQVSFRHALLHPTGAGVRITDLGSTNGVRIDGRPAGESGPAAVGSLIRLGGSVLRLQSTVEPPTTVLPDGQGHLVVTTHRPVPLAPPPPLPPPPGTAPERPRRPLPLLAALLGAGVGGSLALVLRSPSYLAFAALGPATMLGSAISDRAAGRRSHRRALREYHAAVADRMAAICAALDAERLAAWEHWPDPATVARRAGSATRLWERRPGDDDYLRLAVGIGSRPALLDAPEPPAVAEVPITVDLPGVGVLGLTGDHRPLLRWLLAQLVTLHSPADLTMLPIGTSPELLALRELPHVLAPGASGPAGSPGKDLVVVLDGAAASRSAAASAFLDLAAAGSGLPGALTGRAAAPAGRPPAHPAAPAGVDPTGRVSVLCATTSPSDLPGQCAATVLVSGQQARLQAPPRPAVAGAVAQLAGGPADVTGMPAEMFHQLLGALVPLRDARVGSLGLPASLALSELVGPVGAVDLARRWRHPSARAVIGLAADGPVVLDLDADGPHLLIAGTTGSGKSELLQTLIAALALAAPPEDVTFLLVDYKGGSAFAGVAPLPHTVGIVTDLDPGSSARALASLRAELRRRERLAAAHEPAPPRLVIVIDEFATLAGELPEFLGGVVDVAQRGRALGLHLVLATQRPAGVISPAIRANTAARVCLRVTDAIDSLDVIDVPDAAHIGPGTPGRGLLRTAGRVREFQSALVTGPAVLGVQVWRRREPGSPGGSVATHEPATRHGPVTTQGQAPTHEPVTTHGQAPTHEPVTTHAPAMAHGPAATHRPATTHGSVPQRPPRPVAPGPPSELEVLVAAARQAAAGRPVPHPPWLPALPERFLPDPELPDCLAVADLPDRQTRDHLALPDASVLVVGPAGSGRSTALRRIAAIAAGQGAELLVVDAGGALTDLRDWPEVSSWLDLQHPHLVLRLVDLLTDRASRPADGRTRWLIADEYALLTAALERIDYGIAAAALAELPSRGAACGVRVAAAGPDGLVHQRHSAGFPTVIQLGHEPESPIPGRGRWSGTEVQVADAPAGSRPTGGRNAVTDHPGWPDRLVVRPLPDCVPATALPAPTPAAVPIGLGGDAAEPVLLDLANRSGAMLVAGPRRAGISTALDLLAGGAARAGIPVIRVHVGTTAAAGARPAAIDGQPPGTGGSPGDRAGRTLAVTDIDVSDGTQPLRDALAAHRGSLLLVVDQQGAGTGHPAADLLERFCQVAGPGQHLLLGERLDVIARSSRGHLGAVVGFRRGLLLATDRSDGALLDVALPRRTAVPPPGRGFWADAGLAVPVQVARP
jgi:S-DNA-T family DNA segregation ATPase FtsK/SpoIIIE